MSVPSGSATAVLAASTCASSRALILCSCAVIARDITCRVTSGHTEFCTMSCLKQIPSISSRADVNVGHGMS